MFFFQDTLKTAFLTRIQPIDAHKQQFFPKIRALHTLPLLQKSARVTYPIVHVSDGQSPTADYLLLLVIF